MTPIDLFPTTISFSELDNIDLSLFEEYILNSKKIKNGPQGELTEKFNILNDSIFSDLNQKIIDEGKKYLNILGQKAEDLQIIDSWGNVQHKGNYIDSHCHANSYISGCFYITKGSSIIFDNPLLEIKSMKAHTPPDENNLRTWSNYPINPYPGLLLFFPSWLNHSTLPVESGKRVSIAFNMFPKGNFGSLTGRFNLKNYDKR